MVMMIDEIAEIGSSFQIFFFIQEWTSQKYKKQTHDSSEPTRKV